MTELCIDAVARTTLLFTVPLAATLLLVGFTTASKGTAFQAITEILQGVVQPRTDPTPDISNQMNNSAFASPFDGHFAGAGDITHELHAYHAAYYLLL